jgi:hypothetical protein
MSKNPTRWTVGAHHVGLTVPDLAPELMGGGPTRHMMTRIPGNIRVEFIAPAG